MDNRLFYSFLFKKDNENNDDNNNGYVFIVLSFDFSCFSGICLPEGH